MTDQNLNPQNELASEALHGVPLDAQRAIQPRQESYSQLPSFWKSILEKIKPIVTTAFGNFYSNKKIFLPVSIAFCLVFFVIILGLIFGKHRASQGVIKNIPSPTPFTQSTPQATSSGNIIIDSQNQLNDLQNQINNLDIKESRLTPPSLNFDVKF
jgi:hypothetical protein